METRKISPSTSNTNSCPKGKFCPALALGIRDPTGNRLYTGQYLVASKQIYPFDFTLGFGDGRFGKQPLIVNSTDAFGAEIFNHPRNGRRTAALLGHPVLPVGEVFPDDGVQPHQIQPADARPCAAEIFYAARPPAVQFRLSLEAARVDARST